MDTLTKEKLLQSGIALTERERSIIELRFGLTDNRPRAPSGRSASLFISSISAIWTISGSKPGHVF
jgi:DNA-directed RNA polymerase specialized sigma subunit